MPKETNHKVTGPLDLKGLAYAVTGGIRGERNTYNSTVVAVAAVFLKSG